MTVRIRWRWLLAGALLGQLARRLWRFHKETEALLAEMREASDTLALAAFAGPLRG